MAPESPTSFVSPVRSATCRLVLETLAAFACRCLDRHRQRVDLDALDDAALKDIGLSREDVRRECAKPFWR